MVKGYTDHIPFELGVKLKEYGYWNPGCTYDSNYNNPCYFVKSKVFYDKGVVAPWELIVPAPTYAEVFDWFIEKKGIIITLDPFFTKENKNHIAYTWKVSYPDLNNGCIVIRTEEDEWKSSKGFGGSFGLTANDAIEYAMTITVNNEEFIEVNIEDL